MKGCLFVKKLLMLALSVISLVTVAGCGVTNQTATNGIGNTQKQNAVKPLSVLYAGSMTKVMEQKIRPSVNQQFGLAFQGEGKGSTALAQMIRSGLSQPDVFISASPDVFGKLLMGSNNHNIVKWYMTLAEDELVIAYSPKSQFKEKLDAAAKGQVPWYQVLEEKGFRLGRTDPLLDPKGTDTIFMCELASNYYHQPNLAKQILGSNENPNQVFPEESLLAQLTSGQVDAIIAYKHEAVEWGTPYITLPDQINLGNAKLAKEYGKVSFESKDGKVEKGAPIVFTITIPNTASNETGAEEFVKYMVSGDGHDILMKDGFTPIATKVAGNESDVPQSLQSLNQGKSK